MLRARPASYPAFIQPPVLACVLTLLLCVPAEAVRPHSSAKAASRRGRAAVSAGTGTVKAWWKFKKRVVESNPEAWWKLRFPQQDPAAGQAYARYRKAQEQYRANPNSEMAAVWAAVESFKTPGLSRAYGGADKRLNLLRGALEKAARATIKHSRATRSSPPGTHLERTDEPLPVLTASDVREVSKTIQDLISKRQREGEYGEVSALVKVHRDVLERNKTLANRGLAAPQLDHAKFSGVGRWAWLTRPVRRFSAGRMRKAATRPVDKIITLLEKPDRAAGDGGQLIADLELALKAAANVKLTDGSHPIRLELDGWASRIHSQLAARLKAANGADRPLAEIRQTLTLLRAADLLEDHHAKPLGWNPDRGAIGYSADIAGGLKKYALIAARMYMPSEARALKNRLISYEMRAGRGKRRSFWFQMKFDKALLQAERENWPLFEQHVTRQASWAAQGILMRYGTLSREQVFTEASRLLTSAATDLQTLTSNLAEVASKKGGADASHLTAVENTQVALTEARAKYVAAVQLVNDYNSALGSLKAPFRTIRPGNKKLGPLRAKADALIAKSMDNLRSFHNTPGLESIREAATLKTSIDDSIAEQRRDLAEAGVQD